MLSFRQVLQISSFFVPPAGRWEFWRQGSEERVHQESLRNSHVPGKTQILMCQVRHKLPGLEKNGKCHNFTKLCSALPDRIFFTIWIIFVTYLIIFVTITIIFVTYLIKQFQLTLTGVIIASFMFVGNCSGSVSKAYHTYTLYLYLELT